jgi:hypothetical protein
MTDAPEYLRARDIARLAPEEDWIDPGGCSSMSRHRSTNGTIILRVRCRRGSALGNILPMRGTGCGRFQSSRHGMPFCMNSAIAQSGSAIAESHHAREHIRPLFV